MGMCGCVWVCGGVCVHVWICVDFCGFVWNFSVLCGFVRLCVHVVCYFAEKSWLMVPESFGFVLHALSSIVISKTKKCFVKHRMCLRKHFYVYQNNNVFSETYIVFTKT